MNNYNFSVDNSLASVGIAESLKKTIGYNVSPVIVCIGTDSVIGDSLGPFVGSILSEKINCFVYGTLKKPITAKEVNFIRDYVASVHPYSQIFSIDAAVGSKEEIGIIKITDDGIKPGLGVKKNLAKIGNVGIMGVVAERSDGNVKFMNSPRLGAVKNMAEIIADGIEKYILFSKEEEKCVNKVFA